MLPLLLALLRTLLKTTAIGGSSVTGDRRMRAHRSDRPSSGTTHTFLNVNDVCVWDQNQWFRDNVEAESCVNCIPAFLGIQAGFLCQL